MTRILDQMKIAGRRRNSLTAKFDAHCNCRISADCHQSKVWHKTYDMSTIILIGQVLM